MSSTETGIRVCHGMCKSFPFYVLAFTENENVTPFS